MNEASSFIRFGLAGVPGFLVAIPLNVLLIEWAHWPKPLAYLLVVWMQMTSGFLFCHYLVFKRSGRTPILLAYAQFALSMGLIRIVDWSTYTALVEFVQLPYILAQICCTAFFIVIKFFSARAIFRLRVSE